MPELTASRLSVPGAGVGAYGSAVLRGFPVAPDGEGATLGASSEAALLQRWQARVIEDNVLRSATEHLAIIPALGRLLPIFFVGVTAGGESFANSERRERLSARLAAAFEAEPLEDGMRHLAEGILAQALHRGPDSGVLQWIKAMSSDTRQPAFAASVLRCVGRLENPGTPTWRADVVRTALAAADIEIRDAAAVAAEWWGGPGMRAILEAHSEPAPWLRSYIRDVLDDLRG